MLWSILFALGIIGQVLSEDDLWNNFLNSNESLVNKDAVNFTKMEEIFNEKCKEHDAEGTLDEIKNSNIQLCLRSYVDEAKIKNELEVAKHNGTIDEVFDKYCKKWPNVYGCLNNTLTSVRKCLSTNESKSFDKSLDIIHEMQQFICFKEGDRLALFYSEGGVSCMEMQQEELKKCVNTTILNQKLDEEMLVSTLPLIFEEQDCTTFEEFRQCVRTAFEKCPDTTPANVVDAAFKFLKKQTACQKKMFNTESQSSATNVGQSSELKKNSKGYFHLANSLTLTIVSILSFIISF
ncbi:hypothetical protein ABEB36_007249 [Hypothenemus hampei]|uniref:27 kDa hemolymph protein n=1 Tax=Hypothenemus hampei TaxID=57062 RepID=A0ABD1ETI6_HYPHA